MANNKIYIKRTATSGNKPTTAQIANGELAVNMTDGILYSTNGSIVFEIGANTTNSSITGTLTVKSVSANSSNGTAGQVLTSNGTTTYWSTIAAGSGTVTSVGTGNGLTGGPVTTTGTIAVVANTGIVANATGVYVNSAYIGTISANNAAYLGTVAAASYVQNTDSRTLSGNLNFSGANMYFNTGWFVGANVFANTTAMFIGNSTANATATSSLIKVANSTTTADVTPSGIRTFTNSTVNSTVTSALVQVSNSTSTANLTALDLKIGATVVNSSQITATTLVGSVSGSYANITGQVNTATLYAATSANIASVVQANSTGVFVGASVYVNTTAVDVGNTTLTSVLATLGGQVSANGGVGTAGQVLTSGATGNAYWANAAGGGSTYMKGGPSVVGTLASEGQNIFRVNANTLNTNTTFVAGENGQATGPLTIAAGMTLTIETGARVSII